MTRRIGYLVSRFPSPSETFIARELGAVEGTGAEIELMSLFTPKEHLVHPAARPWVDRVRRPGAGEALAAIGWWLVRHPLRLCAATLAVLRGYARSPRHLIRALATLPLAAAHARRLSAEPVDHLHAHYATYPALAAWLCHRLTGTGYSFTCHAHDLYVDQSMLATKLAEARFVVTISHFNRHFLGRYGGDSVTPVHVIRAGIEVGSYPFRPRRPPTSGPVAALTVASLQEYKGHDALLEALTHGGPGVDRVRLELIGSGPLREHLERRARELGLGDRVRLAGARTEAEVRGSLERADLFILPSVIARDGQMEGLPVVLMEALASGVPVVASDLSGVGELISDGVTGILAEPGDPAALAAAIERALAADGERLDLERGRKEVERDYDVAGSAERLAALFEAAISAAA